MIVIGALQQPPQVWLNGDNLEVLTADFVSPHRPGHAVGFHAKILNVKGGHRGKHGIAFAHITHFRIGENGIVRNVGRERHHPVWIRYIQGPQDHHLEHAENDDIGGDPERQNEDCRNGKAGGTAHLANSKSQVLQQGGHGRPRDDLATWKNRQFENQSVANAT